MSNTKVSSEQIIDDVALGGNPTTTTQSAGNNTTRVATTAFVTTAVSNLVDSAPSSLNTLNELAAAMNDNASFFSTVLPLSGGTMTGDLILGDSVQIEFGSASGGDLRIYHDGSNSVILNNTGRLDLRAANLAFKNTTNNETYATFTENGAVELYHDNAAKLATTSTGVTITDNLTLGSDSVASSINILGDVFTLDVDSNGNTGGTPSMRFNISGGEKVRLDSSGNFGIGDTNPSAIRLSVVTPTANHVGLQVENSNTADSFGMIVKGGNDANDYTADFRKRDNTSIMRIRGDGNIGIGTSSPVTKLHVMDGTAQSGISHTYVYDSTSLSIEAGEPAIQLRAEDSGTHGGSLLWRYGNNVFSAIANPTDDTIDYIYGVTNANDFAVHSGSQMTSYRKIMTLGADGNVGIGDGNLKFASGHGIDFSATANTSATGGSTSQELLDDYEEGTWTATLSSSGGGFAASVTSFSGGHYTKIGNMVTAHIYTGSFNITNAGSGYAKIGGLPYASMYSAADYGSAIFYHSNCFAESSVTGYVSASADFTISTPTDQDVVGAVGWRVANTVYLMVQVQYMTPN